MGDDMGGGNHNGAGGRNPDTRADDHTEQLQTWFIQETEKDLQEVTLEGVCDHRRSSLWQLYQRKVAVARTTRPWNGRLSVPGQRKEESCTSDASYWTNGECTHHEQ